MLFEASGVVFLVSFNHLSESSKINYSQFSLLRWTPVGPALTVCLKEVSDL